MNDLSSLVIIIMLLIISPFIKLYSLPEHREKAHLIIFITVLSGFFIIFLIQSFLEFELKKFLMGLAGSVFLISGFAFQFISYKLASFKITEESLNKIKKEDIPENIIVRLEGLKDQEYNGTDEFTDALKRVIEEKETVQYKFLILERALLCLPKSPTSAVYFKQEKYKKLVRIHRLLYVFAIISLMIAFIIHFLFKT